MANSLDRPLPDDLSEQADRLMRRLAERRLSVATAESCTGGLLAALLTDIEGASHAFDRGVVAYAETAKVDLLGIDPDVLRQNDAVSEAVARAMAESMLRRAGTDLAAAITGFAGPAAPGMEEGLVHLAVAGREVATRHRVEHFGAIGRGPVRICALRSALELIEETLATIPPAGGGAVDGGD
jgi:nicotinamide-nucleotide amidase